VREEPAPAAENPAPAPKPAAASAEAIEARLAEANTALEAKQLGDARTLFRAVLGLPDLPRRALIRSGEGLYRSRDFEGALIAFRRVMPLQRGEEPYRYYVAVALYETGDHAGAKEMLSSALPYIELSPEVARYREKIESAKP
jgi:tetratricopeptide (TPR) repeat protein